MAIDGDGGTILRQLPERYKRKFVSLKQMRSTGLQAARFVREFELFKAIWIRMCLPRIGVQVPGSTEHTHDNIEWIHCNGAPDKKMLSTIITSRPLLTAMVLTMAVVPVFSILCARWGFVDHPGGRKQHARPVPLAGGPAIVLATITTLVLSNPLIIPLGFLLCGVGLATLGALDDKYDISPSVRLLSQFILVGAALWTDHLWIGSLGHVLGFDLNLSWLGLPLTILGIMGVINAMNMLDGVDGLASGVALIIVFFIDALALAGHDGPLLSISLTVTGAIIGFWAFNYRFKWRSRARVFMGDSGTMFIGFALPYIALALASTSPMWHSNDWPALLLWLFALPIWDITSVIISRIRRGVSPFSAGRDHIHHRLMELGLSPRRTVHLIYSLALLGASFGISLKFLGATTFELGATFVLFSGIYVDRIRRLTEVLEARVKRRDTIVPIRQEETGT